MSCKKDGYPYDFDASLRITRFPGEYTLHPHPQMIGSVNPFLPLFDMQQVIPMSASSGFGPMAVVYATGKTEMDFSQFVMYDLPKVGG